MSSIINTGLDIFFSNFFSSLSSDTSATDDPDQFKYYFYAVDFKVIPKGGGEEDTIDLSGDIAGLSINRDHFYNTYPLFSVSGITSPEKCLRIRDNYKEARCYITIKMGRLKSKEEIEKSEDKQNTVLYLGVDYLKNVELLIIEDPNWKPLHTSDSDIPSMVHPSVSFEFKMIPHIALRFNKKINNFVAKNTTTAVVAAYLTQDCKPQGVEYPFYAAMPDNARLYEDILIPPMNYTEAIRYIDRVYGLYTGQISLFLDIDRATLFSSTKGFSPNNTQKYSATNYGDMKPPTVKIQIIKPESAVMAVGSGWDDEAQEFIVRTPFMPSAFIKAQSQKELHGQNISLFRTTQSIRSHLENGELGADGTYVGDEAREKIYFQKYDNGLGTKKFENTFREQYAPVVLGFECINVLALDYLYLWKVETFETSDKPFSNNWYSLGCQLLFNKNSNTQNWMSLLAFVVIKPTSGEGVTEDFNLNAQPTSESNNSAT